MVEKPAFAGFEPAALHWFAGLQDDNSKGWFAAHRETYESAVRGALEGRLARRARGASDLPPAPSRYGRTGR